MADQSPRADVTAVALLYEQFARLVFRAASRIIHDPVRADDVLQATFLQALQQADRFDPARGTASAWLLAIARSRALDHLRAARVRNRVSVEIDEQHDVRAAEMIPNPEDACLAGEVSARLLRALQVLPVPNRLPVEMAFYRGLTHAEVAIALRQPLGTVKTRIRRAIDQLRTLLAAPDLPSPPDTEPSPFSVALAEYLSVAPVTPREIDAALDGIQVLVVDDDLETVELVRTVLESSGALVRSARSADEAIVRLREAWPDALLTDLGMPREDGYALLRRVRQLGAAARALPAGAFTARPDDRARVLAAGFAVHVRKPIDPGALVDAVAAMTRAVSAQRAVRALRSA
ncbi:MAG: sigma-70 family RNA polymerase sigma factor [Acidobacteriota bacterium]